MHVIYAKLGQVSEADNEVKLNIETVVLSYQQKQSTSISAPYSQKL